MQVSPWALVVSKPVQQVADLAVSSPLSPHPSSSIVSIYPMWQAVAYVARYVGEMVGAVMGLALYNKQEVMVRSCCSKFAL